MFPNKHIVHLRKSLKNKKIAITGSTGFIAKNVIRILKDYNLTNKKIILLNKKILIIL